MNVLTKYKFQDWSILIFLIVLSLILAWFIYGMGGAVLAKSFNLYTKYDGEILFEDSAIMSSKQAFIIGLIYYVIIMCLFFFILRYINFDSKQRKIHLTFLVVFNLLLCLGIGYLLSSPFIE